MSNPAPRWKHGAFSWGELLTTDVEGAKKFYTEVFGWKFDSMPMPGTEGEPTPETTYHVASNAHESEGGIMLMPKEMPEGTPPHWGTYVTVLDCDKVAEAVAANGGTVLNPPFDVPGVGRMTHFLDPQGAKIAAITYVPKDDLTVQP